MKYFLTITILLFVLVARSFCQSDDGLIYKQSVFFSDPEKFLIINEDSAVINDPTHSKYPVYLMNLKSGEILNRVRRGRGPGEMGGMYKVISYARDGDICVFDRGLLRVNIYDDELVFKKTIDLISDKAGAVHAGWFLKRFTIFCSTRS